MQITKSLNLIACVSTTQNSTFKKKFLKTENCHRPEEFGATWQFNVMWYPGAGRGY